MQLLCSLCLFYQVQHSDLYNKVGNAITLYDIDGVFLSSFLCNVLFVVPHIYFGTRLFCISINRSNCQLFHISEWDLFINP
jgi:hypothetical protein